MDELPATRFGRFELRAGQRQLLQDDAPVAIGARALDVLVALVARRDRVVGKNELLEAVWPGLVVEENNLPVQVSALRKLLGAHAIATVPGRGYRFTLSPDEPRSGTAPALSPPVPGSAGVGSGPPTSPLPGRTNLPAWSSPLFGRAQDMAQVSALLEAHRVVSIVGAGGIGKTRLAQAVGAEVAGSYADGIWSAELAALAEGRLVASEVARVLALPQSQREPTARDVADAVGARSLLLLLDNCEHLLDAVAELVAAISRAAPGVRILVTSQEPLKIQAEHVHRLSTLSLPARKALEEVQASGAVQLFVSRAQEADPRFALTPGNMDAVVDICARLDGIPLALELAAARVSLLGVDGLRARLDERLQVLTGGSRFVLRRHQTLRAALDFSHGLLSAEERAVFRRLGVFAGSFAPDTAQQLATDEAIDSWAVLDHLGALVDKSMVVAEGGNFPRLRLLETTRAFALEKLADAGETATLLRRHAHSQAQLATRMNDDFWTLTDEQWMDRYEAELDNFRAALAWSLREDAELAVALAGDSRSLWLALALQPEARFHCEAALARVSAATPRRAAGRLWNALAAMLGNTLPTQSLDAAARAVELLREADDPRTLAAALMNVVQEMPGETRRQTLEELHRLASQDASARLQMLFANASARAHRNEGHYVEARRDYELARDLAARCGATAWVNAMQGNVADIALMLGDVAEAILIYRELAQRMRPLRDQLFYMYALASLSTALLFESDSAGAREALTLAAPLIVGHDLGARYAATAALLAAQEGRLPAAARLLGYGVAAFAAHQLLRHDPAELRARELALQRLAASAEQGSVDRWQREGAALTVEEAYRLALATGPG